MKLNKDQQWKTVIDALAVALVAIGVPHIRKLRSTIELDFNSAWRNWPQSSSYPSINPDHFYVYVMKSARRNGAHGAFTWEGDLTAMLVGGTDWWEPDELLEFIAEHSDTSADAWKSLATSFATPNR